MMHRWTSKDGYYDCMNCGMSVDNQPFDEGYYPLSCDPSESQDPHYHHIVASIAGSECYYCNWTYRRV